MRAGDVGRRFGIGEQGDVHAVAAARGFAAQAAETALLARQLAHAAAVGAQCVGARVDGHFAGQAVDDQHVAVADLLQRIGGGDHHRQMQAAR